MFIDLAYNSNQVEQGKEDDHDIFPDYQSCALPHLPWVPARWSSWSSSIIIVMFPASSKDNHHQHHSHACDHHDHHMVLVLAKDLGNQWIGSSPPAAPALVLSPSSSSYILKAIVLTSPIVFISRQNLDWECENHYDILHTSSHPVVVFVNVMNINRLAQATS